MQTVLHLAPNPPFDFKGTAYSHGWVVLAPNAWDKEHETMTRVEQLRSGKVVALEISGEGTARKPSIKITATHRGRLGGKDTEDLQQRVSHMFRLDEDLSRFYAVCKERGDHWLKVTAGRGRLLRSPSLFEDVVKIICTTNTQWGGTKRMVAALVDSYGAPYPEDPARRAFPTPQAIAEADSDEFAANVRMGYRAAYVQELAQRVASGDLDLQALAASDLETAGLRKRVLGIKGIGNYAASTLLMLLGRYDTLAIDSVCRDFVKKKYFDGRVPADAEIRGIYQSWGEWQFLAYWFDLVNGFKGEL